MAHRDWYCEDVLSGEISVRRTFEDEDVLAFHQPQPVSDVHVVVVPKNHVPSLLDESALDGEMLSSMMLAVQVSAKALGLDRSGHGFYVRANAAAPGVTQHMHWHILTPADGNWPQP